MENFDLTPYTERMAKAIESGDENLVAKIRAESIQAANDFIMSATDNESRNKRAQMVIQLFDESVKKFHQKAKL
ncbi:MAG: hypothetical protein EAZ97_12075 [Bacteroidetes bacterium]|nr:MAG: hypothetical protein EAZ97_12075 [Bacteroidota bacterium]